MPESNAEETLSRDCQRCDFRHVDCLNTKLLPDKSINHPFLGLLRTFYQETHVVGSLNAELFYGKRILKVLEAFKALSVLKV